MLSCTMYVQLKQDTVAGLNAHVGVSQVDPNKDVIQKDSKIGSYSGPIRRQKCHNLQNE